MPIGESLRRARTKRGLELASGSEAIKIRVRYLRALEAEDWDVMPAPAYARGFLRTYAAYLGLDADALVEEYRRSADPPSVEARPSERASPAAPGIRSRGPIGPRAIAALAVAAVVLV